MSYEEKNIYINENNDQSEENEELVLKDNYDYNRRIVNEYS